MRLDRMVAVTMALAPSVPGCFRHSKFGILCTLNLVRALFEAASGVAGDARLSGTPPHSPLASNAVLAQDEPVFNYSSEAS